MTFDLSRWTSLSPAELGARLGVPTLPAVPETAGAADPGTATAVQSFGEVLGRYLNEVNGAQHRADELVERLALGEPVEVHQVMLALNEASHALQMTLQVRAKLLEAYQELMRTPL